MSDRKHILITALMLACACATPIDWTAECEKRGEHRVAPGVNYVGCIGDGFQVLRAHTRRDCDQWIARWQAMRMNALDYCDRDNVAVREW